MQELLLMPNQELMHTNPSQSQETQESQENVRSSVMMNTQALLCTERDKLHYRRKVDIAETTDPSKNTDHVELMASLTPSSGNTGITRIAGANIYLPTSSHTTTETVRYENNNNNNNSNNSNRNSSHAIVESTMLPATSKDMCKHVNQKTTPRQEKRQKSLKKARYRDTGKYYTHSIIMMIYIYIYVYSHQNDRKFTVTAPTTYASKQIVHAKSRCK